MIAATYFLEEIVYNWCELFLQHLVEFSNETVRARMYLFWSFKIISSIPYQLWSYSNY